MGIWDVVYSSADAVKQRLPDPSPVKSACWSACGTIGSAVKSVSSSAPNLTSPVVGAVRWSCNRGLAAAHAVDRTVRVEGVKRVKESVPVPDKEVLGKIGGVALGLTDLALDKYSRPFTANWWSNFGHQTPNLQKLARRILLLTTSSSGCERNWSTFEGGLMLGNYQRMGLMMLREWMLQLLMLQIFCQLNLLMPDTDSGIPAYKLVRDAFVMKKDTETIDQDKVKELQSRVERLERVTQGPSLPQPQPQPQPYGPRLMVGVHHKPEDIVRVFMMKGFAGGDFTHDQVALQHSNWKRDVLLTPVPSSMYE